MCAHVLVSVYDMPLFQSVCMNAVNRERTQVIEGEGQKIKTMHARVRMPMYMYPPDIKYLCKENVVLQCQHRQTVRFSHQAKVPQGVFRSIYEVYTGHELFLSYELYLHLRWPSDQSSG